MHFTVFIKREKFKLDNIWNSKFCDIVSGTRVLLNAQVQAKYIEMVN